MNNALLNACGCGDFDTINNLVMVPEIKEIINQQDDHGYTALMLMANVGNIGAVRKMLQVPGIDVNIKNKYNNTALMEAVDYNHKNIVIILLDVPGIDVNVKDTNGITALNNASYCNYIEIVRILLNVPEIDVNFCDIYGTSAIVAASFNDNIDIIKLLLQETTINIFNDADTINHLLVPKKNECVNIVKEYIIKKLKFLGEILSHDILRHIIYNYY